MDFKDIEHKYKLDFNGLAAILKEKHIVLKLDHLNDIPNEWIPLVEESLGLVTSKKQEKETKNSEQKGINKKERIKKKKELEARKREAIRKSRIKGSTTIEHPSLSVVKNKSENTFYAYVKFIGPELDHAFIKRINDINSISSLDMRARDDSDFKIIEDCSALQRGQIILCEIKSKKHNVAKISSEILEGTISNNNQAMQFIDWLSFDFPVEMIKIKTFGFQLEDTFVTATLFYHSNSLRLKKLVDKANEKDIISNMEYMILELISKVTVPENIQKYIDVYKTNAPVSNFETLVLSQFKKDLSEPQNFINEEKVNAFVEKWQCIEPSLVTFTNIKHDEYFFIFFEMWIKRKLPLNFWGGHLIESCIKYQSTTNESVDTVLTNVLQKSHLEIVSPELEIYINSEFEIFGFNEFKVLNGLVSASILQNKETLKVQILNKLSRELSFELWLNEENGKFDKELAIEIFPNSNLDLQSRILNELSSFDILPLLPLINEVSDSKIEKKVYETLLISIANQLDFICFDLETNGVVVDQIGWVDHKTNENFFSNTNEIDSGLEEFDACILSTSTIFIGHNIVEWDIPILSKFEVNIPQNQIWDTLLVEAFLSPEFKNYALVTAHNAIDDAKLTRELFLNQFWRILYMQEDKLMYLFSYLPINIVEKIKELKSKKAITWKPLALINSEKRKFFRPQPTPNALVKKLKNRIAALEANNILIVGSDKFKNEILSIENIKFHCNDATNKDLYKLNETKIQEIDDTNAWEKQVLLNYVNYNTSLSQPTFWAQLPISAKIKIENNVDNVLDLFYPNEEIIWSGRNVMYFTIPELLLYQDQLSQLNDINVITVHNDLLSVENKKVLKEVSLDFLMSEIKNDDHIWLKFSGGQSFSELTLEQCEDLEVDIPKPFDNIWIEKVTLNKFNIWGNFNWENLLLTLDISNIEDIQPNAAILKKEQTIISKVSAVETLKNKVIRFNPESLYRSRYWVFQKQLIDQIVNQEKASVLLIQNYDEIEILQNYFSHLKYYIPKQSISIGRRLELLHQNKSTFKLIIEHISQLDRIIQANHVDSLNIIFDSFNLSENYYSALNSSYFKKLNSKRLKRIHETEDDDSENTTIKNDVLNTSKKPVISDTFFLLELLKPKISHIRNLLHYADPNHRLWILDPRCNDFSSLYESWNVSHRTLKIWKDFETYEVAVKEADKHIDSLNPIEDLPIDKERIKKILRQVFLNEFNWRPSQIPYLDLIIEGNKDQLITLPTGEGKSVLFQGPALFKSAFTNRLTIVVTPLKALMEDQVDALWDKGFFGSVDYINSDRSSEVYSIYRAMAGGELSLLFVTPERFRSRSFNNALQMRIQSDGGLEYGVFDEAHCVSQWGHEFRPDYFNCAKRMVKLKKISSNNFPLLLFSATVSEKIYNDFNTIFS
mgnify:CR=1 FL=1